MNTIRIVLCLVIVLRRIHFLGYLDERKHSFDKTMTGEETILLIKQPLQHHQGDNSTFVIDDADETELGNKMIIAL